MYAVDKYKELGFKRFSLRLFEKVYICIRDCLFSIKKRIEYLFFLKHKSFTIISNNCFGGWIYQKYKIGYQSPTVGMFILGDDYIKFIKNLKHYIDYSIRFIEPEEAHNTVWLENNVEKFGHYPIGRIDDVDIHFLHAKSSDKAESDWNRRKKRIDYKHVIVKYSMQNAWSEENYKAFVDWDFPDENKLLFTTEKKYGKPYEILFKCDKGNDKTTDAKYYRYVNLTKVINNMKDSEMYFE